MFEMLYVIKIGIFAGIIMSLVGMILGKLKFTNLDLTTYLGCFLTGQSKGKAPMIAGTLVHIFMSGFFAVLYVRIIAHLAEMYNILVEPTLYYGIIFGLVHSVISGAFLVVFDKINPCVANKKVACMGFATSAHGKHAVITYVLIHIVYATIIIRHFA